MAESCWIKKTIESLKDEELYEIFSRFPFVALRAEFYKDIEKLVLIGLSPMFDPIEEGEEIHGYDVQIVFSPERDRIIEVKVIRKK